MTAWTENFIGIGYGKPSQILERLPEGTQSIIRDDDAAEAGMNHAWFASCLPAKDAEAEYLAAFDADGDFNGYTYTLEDLKATAGLIE